MSFGSSGRILRCMYCIGTRKTKSRLRYPTFCTGDEPREAVWVYERRRTLQIVTLIAWVVVVGKCLGESGRKCGVRFSTLPTSLRLPYENQESTASHYQLQILLLRRSSRKSAPPPEEFLPLCAYDFLEPKFSADSTESLKRGGDVGTGKTYSSRRSSISYRVLERSASCAGYLRRGTVFGTLVRWFLM
jgi:hypothetical protein